MERHISINQAENLISKYSDNNGEVFLIEEGVLGLGTILLYDYNNKLKCYIIQEYYVNPWNSGHSIKTFSKLPKKYQPLLDKAEALYY